MDILDQEASEDEGLRSNFERRHGKPSPRPPSYEVNVELTAKDKRYRQVLDEAARSDELVRDKWIQWEGSIERLTWDEVSCSPNLPHNCSHNRSHILQATLEEWVPSSTVGASSSPDKQTSIHARALRAQLESLDAIFRSRDTLVSRARHLSDNDDIHPRIMREAAGLARWAAVEPAMFEETLDAELAKYDKFKDAIEEGNEEQTQLLESIQTTYDQFILSRQEDESVKERERAMQSLDLAYHKYREIVRNLEEGLKFYNDLAGILGSYQEAAKEWVRTRRDDMSILAETIRSLDISSPADVNAAHTNEVQVSQDTEPAVPEGRKSPPAQPPPRKTFALPPPDSDEWQAMPMPSRPTNAATPSKKSKRT